MTQKIAYNTAEAADAAGVSIETIRAAIRSGDLKVIKPEINGRKIATRLISPRALAKWALGEEPDDTS